MASYESGQPCSIGELRWKVVIAKRADTPTGTYNIDEEITPLAEVYAEIKPVSLQVFVGAQQIEFGITHRITFRWQPFFELGLFQVILRDIILPDGTTRKEIYQIRRVEEWQGRHRWVIAETELQRLHR
jgi:hypothetical protein